LKLYRFLRFSSVYSLDHRLRCAVALQAPFTKKADRSEGQRDTRTSIESGGFRGGSDILSVCLSACLAVRSDPIRNRWQRSNPIRGESTYPHVQHPTSDQFCIACQEFRLHCPARVGKFRGPIGGLRVINIT